MIFYVLFEAFVGIVGGIMLAVCTKKAEGVRYGTLDNVGRVTNVLLTVLYALLLPVCLFLGIISEPDAEGLLMPLSWIVCLIVASAPMVCGLGLGSSVALRKKGKSGLGFAVQFAGVIGVALALLFYCVFAGSLIASLN